MIKAAIYDLDDLMINSEPLHQESWRVLVERHGGDFDLFTEEIHSSFIGKRISEIVPRMIEIFSLEMSYDQAWKERHQILYELVEQGLELMPGLKKSLKFFRKKGLKVAIASSGTSHWIETILGKFKLHKYFDEIVSSDHVKNGKPHPEPYLLAAKRLGLKPKECVVLEDATNGILSAKAAGCFCIAVKNSNTPPQNLCQADIILDSLKQVDLTVFSRLKTS